MTKNCTKATAEYIQKGKKKKKKRLEKEISNKNLFKFILSKNCLFWERGYLDQW